MPKKAAAASGGEPGTPTKKAAKSAAGKMTTKYKKAPDAPKRFKSAFIIFSADKHKEIKRRLEMEGRPEKTTDIAKLVSEAWKQLSPEDREEWEVKAEQDRARYEAEKASYKGPWKIPAHNKRSTKDPSAPKRPMSAFLAYSNSRRAALKRKNPKATNADLSKMLSKSWKELPAAQRAKYMAEEASLRAKYKQDMQVWRKKAAKQKKQERVERVERGEMPAPTPPAAIPQNPARAAAAAQPTGMNQQQQAIMEQMQMQQDHYMGGGMDPMSQMGDQRQQMQQLQQHGGMDMFGGQDMSGLGDGSHQADGNMNARSLLAGQNPYALQGLGGGFGNGLGGFPGGGGLGAFGGQNPYLANALANQAYMNAPGPAGQLSGLMGQQYLQNPGMMSQLANPSLQQGLHQQGLNQGLNPGLNQSLNQGLNQGLYGQNLGGYGLGQYDG